MQGGIDQGTDKKKKKKRIQLGEMKKKKRKGTRAGKHRPFSSYLERGWREPEGRWEEQIGEEGTRKEGGRCERPGMF
jgi:hypothetical protein